MSEPDSSAAGARVAVRLGSDYMLRSLQMLGELADGELLPALISLAIVQANVAHLEQEGGFRELDEPPQDENRRPISILAIANGLGLPYETTRRHVEKMIAAGQCARVRGGVIVPTAALTTPRHREFVLANLANLRRLYRNLRRAGVSLD
ncbi:hypothetical protein [Phenylobacterium sp.]|uniref:hypothetical protein n=1 Tax=Phenylobacterium sp. TaxID=1871053 RepID=UPI0025E8B979|nr:hypothetical protein [Phenylobacterium sp.]